MVGKSRTGRNQSDSFQLPMPQVKEANGGSLDPDGDLPSGTVTVAVPAYNAMAKDDRVKLTWQGFRSDESSAPPFVNTKTLTAAQVGQALSWSVARSYVTSAAGGRIEVSYAVTYAPPTQDTPSEVQHLIVVAPEVPTLPAARIKALDGPILNPSVFPNGAVIVIEPYPGIQCGDVLALYWSAARADKSVVKSLRIDQSNVDSGKVELTIEKAWIDANVGGEITVTYQYARSDASGSASPLTFQIGTPLVLPAPSVVGAVPENGQSTLDPMNIGDNVIVRVPGDATISPEDQVTVKWSGSGATGSYDALEPVAPGSRDFAIPRSAIPANIGDKVAVSYIVTLPGSSGVPSGTLDLFVKKIDQLKFSRLQCSEASNGTLRLSAVPDGAPLYLEPWLFIAEDQRVSFTVEGVDHSDQPLTEPILDDHPVSNAEATSGIQGHKIPVSILNRLQLDEAFHVNVIVKLDKDVPGTTFPTLRLTLVR